MTKNSDNTDRKGRTDEVKGIFFPTPPAEFNMPKWYEEMLGNIKQVVANGRRQVMWTANVQMSMMYYQIGKNILERQSTEGWGSKVVDRLSLDLKEAFPELGGFSPRNLKYMRRFAEEWPDESIVQRCVAQLPWRHNICLMEKVKEPNRRLAYAMAAIENGWSKTILELQLENYTLERTGKMPSNFGKTLPDVQSDMVQQMFKDPYLLDFTGADAMMGQLAFYQSVVDDTLRHETDERTIGLLLVKSKDETVVKYSLESFNKPMGVASWETEIEKDIADKWKSTLPTIEEIEQELNKS